MLARIRRDRRRLPVRARRDNVGAVRSSGSREQVERGEVTLAWLHVLILVFAVAGPPQDPSSADGDAKGVAVLLGRPSRQESRRKRQGDEKPDQDAKKTQRRPTAAKKPRGEAGSPKAAPGPRVLTRSEMQKRAARSSSRPVSEGDAADRYGPGTPDWSEIPPWRQTSFFGIRAPGRFFVYVIDCSESMIEEDRFARATMEVRRSVLALQAPQQFEVIFYNDGVDPDARRSQAAPGRQPEQEPAPRPGCG